MKEETMKTIFKINYQKNIVCMGINNHYSPR